MDRRPTEIESDDIASAYAGLASAHALDRDALFQPLVVKDIARSRLIDAVSFYHGLTLRPLVTLLGLRHRPLRFDFGNRGRPARGGRLTDRPSIVPSPRPAATASTSCCPYTLALEHGRRVSRAWVTAGLWAGNVGPDDRRRSHG